MSALTKKDLQDEVERLQGELERLRASLAEETAAHRRVKAQRDRFFTLSTDMLCLADLTGRLQDVSPGFERTLGHTRRHLLTKPFLAFIHPEDRASAQAEMEHLAAGLPAVDLDLRWRCEDGTYKWLAWTAVSAPDEGLIYAIARDTSERRLSRATLAEERHLLYALIDSLPDRIYVKDAEGHYLLSNLAHRQFLNLNTADEVRGKTVFDFFPHTLAAKFYVDDQLVILEGKTLINREEPIAGKDGVLRWTATTKVPLRDSRGQVVGLICSSRDITDRERRRELEHAQEHAERVEEVRELILDPETPVQALSGSA